MKFTIKGRLPGLNELIESSRRSKYGANNQKRDVQQYISFFIPKGTMKRPCFVLITFYEPDNRRDVDNIISGGCKLILDSLVHCGTLPNDNRKWVKQITPVVLTDKDNPRVEVELRATYD